MLHKDDLQAILDTISPAIDARARTTETIIKAHVSSEIKASEARTKKELRGELHGAKEELRAEILAARAEAKADSLSLAAKVIKREKEQDNRLDALEEDAGLSNPTKH